MTTITTWWAQSGPVPETTSVCVEAHFPDGGVLARRWVISDETAERCPPFVRQAQLAFFATKFARECSYLAADDPPVEVKGP
jgi:hypothetical protein